MTLRLRMAAALGAAVILVAMLAAWLWADVGSPASAPTLLPAARAEGIVRRTEVAFADGGFAALYMFVYAQVIERHEFGIYGMLVVGMGVLQTVAGTGLRQAITRFVAHARGENALSRLRLFAVQGLGLTLATTLATLLAGFVVYELWGADFAEVPRSDRRITSPIASRNSVCASSPARPSKSSTLPELTRPVIAMHFTSWSAATEFRPPKPCAACAATRRSWR
jgi:hypothetical protein